MSKTIVIIGGVAGGASCAARLRRQDEWATIIMLEKGPFVSFANCGLPYYIGNKIKKEEDLLVADVQLFRERFNIDARALEEVTSINTDKKSLTVKKLSTDEEYEQMKLHPVIGAEIMSRIEQLKEMIDTNVSGTLWPIRAAVPGLSSGSAAQPRLTFNRISTRGSSCFSTR